MSRNSRNQLLSLLIVMLASFRSHRILILSLQSTSCRICQPAINQIPQFQVSLLTSLQRYLSNHYQSSGEPVSRLVRPKNTLRFFFCFRAFYGWPDIYSSPTAASGMNRTYCSMFMTIPQNVQAKFNKNNGNEYSLSRNLTSLNCIVFTGKGKEQKAHIDPCKEESDMS